MFSTLPHFITTNRNMQNMISNFVIFEKSHQFLKKMTSLCCKTPWKSSYILIPNSMVTDSKAFDSEFYQNTFIKHDHIYELLMWEKN